jgi:hypothetical protein
MKPSLLFLAAAAASLCGCASYQYRIVQPPTNAVIDVDHRATVRLDPLEYHLAMVRDRLSLTISNPTEDRLAILGNRSFVVDPRGESHPLRGAVLGPRSFTRMYLPPPPLSYAYPDGYGWGWGWGWGSGWGPYNPYWGPYYGAPYWGPPPISYYQITTAYDWNWKTGPARLRLTYDRNGKSFEHDFEFIRELKK